MGSYKGKNYKELGEDIKKTFTCGKEIVRRSHLLKLSFKVIALIIFYGASKTEVVDTNDKYRDTDRTTGSVMCGHQCYSLC